MGSKEQYSTHLDGDLKSSVEELREREGGDSKAPKSEALRAIVREWSREHQKGAGDDRLWAPAAHFGSAAMAGAVVLAVLGLTLPMLTFWETLAGTLILAVAGAAPIAISLWGGSQ